MFSFYHFLFVRSADIIYYVCLAVNSFFIFFYFYIKFVCKTDNMML
nr:MAG TPA: hypothetical protein [Caudoviricetes sp.]